MFFGFRSICCEDLRLHSCGFSDLFSYPLLNSVDDSLMSLCLRYILCFQCADLGQLIEHNKNTASESAGFDAASRIWTGIEIVAQLDLLGINVKKFSELQVNIFALSFDRFR